jgi:hypothetical protein
MYSSTRPTENRQILLTVSEWIDQVAEGGGLMEDCERIHAKFGGSGSSGQSRTRATTGLQYFR